MKLLFLISVLLVFSLPAHGQDPKPLKNAEVIEMTKADLSDAIVIAKIKNSKCDFDTSPAGLVELKAKGVSDEVVEAMIDWKPRKDESATEDEHSEQEEPQPKNKEIVAAERVISALRRLDNAIAVGVTFQNYSSLLIDNKTIIDENLRDISDPQFLFAVGQALGDHNQYAMSVWNLAVANGWAVFYPKREPGRTLVTRYGVPVKISIWTEVPVMTGLNYVWLSARNYFNSAASRLKTMSSVPSADQPDKPTTEAPVKPA